MIDIPKDVLILAGGLFALLSFGLAMIVAAKMISHGRKLDKPYWPII